MADEQQQPGSKAADSGDDSKQPADQQDASGLFSEETDAMMATDKLGGDFVVVDDADVHDEPTPAPAEALAPSSPRRQCKCKCEPDAVVKKNEKETSDDASSVQSALQQQKESKVSGEKSAEVDSLIITADEVELENEMETKDKKGGARKKGAVKKAADRNPLRFVWVSNISRTTTASELKRHFSEYGKIRTAKIVTDGKRCFGHVSFQKAENALTCIEHLNDTYFEGKKIEVSTAKPEREPADAVRTGVGQGVEKIPKELNSARRRNSRADPLTTVFVVESPERPRSSNRGCDHDESLQKETERLKRRLHEEEMKMKEERRKQKRREEAQREMEFKLNQERQKLKMERELFEKERQEVFRLDQERRKLEEEKLEIMRYKAKLEDEVRAAKKRKLNSEFERSRSVEKQSRAVKSKIGDVRGLSKDPPYSRNSRSGSPRSRSRSRGKPNEGRYRREDVPKQFIRTPPAPKMTEIPRPKYHHHHHHQERFSDENKYYQDKGSPERKFDDYRFAPKKLAAERRSAKAHRDGKNVLPRDRFRMVSPYEPSDTWKSNTSAPIQQKIGEGWPQVSGVEQWKASDPQETSSAGRYQNSAFQYQNYGSATRTWYADALDNDCHHYDHYGQPSIARKY